MALDRDALRDALKAAFQAGMEGGSAEDAAAALADAIDGYVRAAEVAGVQVSVVDQANNPLGTGTQSGAVTLS